MVLDMQFPYNGWTATTAPVTGKWKTFPDTPGLGLGEPALYAPETIQITYDSQFRLYLMYLAPDNELGAAHEVPLDRRDWKAMADATKPANSQTWSGADSGSGWVGGSSKFPDHPVWSAKFPQ
jgi:hypothetical protein